MMIALEPIEYGNARRVVERLGLGPLLTQLLATIKKCQIFIMREKEGNGAGAIADKLVRMLKGVEGWREGKTAEGEPDFLACIDYKGARVCIGVEIQISARSVQVYQDVVHLRSAVRERKIDACVIVINSDEARRLSARGGSQTPDAALNVIAREPGTHIFLPGA